MGANCDTMIGAQIRKLKYCRCPLYLNLMLIFDYSKAEFESLEMELLKKSSFSNISKLFLARSRKHKLCQTLAQLPRFKQISSRKHFIFAMF